MKKCIYLKCGKRSLEFESHSSQRFFEPLISQLLKLYINCDDQEDSYLRSVSGAGLLALFLELIVVEFWQDFTCRGCEDARSKRCVQPTNERVKWTAASFMLLYSMWRASFNCGRTNKVKHTINLLLTWLVNYFSPLLLLTCEFFFHC